MAGMGSFFEVKKILDDALGDTTKPWEPAFKYLEEKTGLKRIYIFFIFVACVAVYLIFGYAAQLLCNFLSFLYPAYASIKAIESPRTDDDKKWLTYWTVFALFSLIDYPSELLLRWVPFYWLLKCVFMVWLFLPFESNGSVILYNNVIKPRFQKHQSKIDEQLKRGEDLVKGVFSAVKEHAKEK